MPDSLSADPVGLQAAATTMTDLARGLSELGGTAPGGRHASGAGAAILAESVTAFGQAYAGRLADHGRAAAAAASNYTETDDDGAAGIRRVSP